jgi:hypothetical protein
MPDRHTERDSDLTGDTSRRDLAPRSFQPNSSIAPVLPIPRAPRTRPAAANRRCPRPTGSLTPRDWSIEHVLLRTAHTMKCSGSGRPAAPRVGERRGESSMPRVADRYAASAFRPVATTRSTLADFESGQRTFWHRALVFARLNSPRSKTRPIHVT